METTFNQLPQVLKNIIQNNPLKIIFSNRTSISFEYKKADAVLKDDYYLLSLYTQKKVFNKKLNIQQLQKLILDYINYFKQINIFNSDYEYTIKTSKKDKIFVMKQKTKTIVKATTQHNRTKNYLIPEGTIVPPLVDMGILQKMVKLLVQCTINSGKSIKCWKLLMMQYLKVI